MPTVHCLVQLIESPYTVVPLGDVEIVNLERVGFNGKTFDLVVVFKDFDRETLMIGSIPAQSLDDIKNWLTTQDIKFFESKLNLQWKQILKTVVADPDEFQQTVSVLRLCVASLLHLLRDFSYLNNVGWRKVCTPCHTHVWRGMGATLKDGG